MKNITVAIISSILLFTSAVSAFAATEECTTNTGSYGQTSTTCKVLSETTTVYHDVSKVDSGVGDINFWMIASILGVVGFSLFGISKLAERVYWFD